MTVEPCVCDTGFTCLADVHDDEIFARLYEERGGQCLDCDAFVSLPFFVGSGGQCPDCLADCALLPLTAFNTGSKP